MGEITSERRERMFDTHSQEQMIYNNLAGQIQLGFFDDGERFPSVQEVAPEVPGILLSGAARAQSAGKGWSDKAFPRKRNGGRRKTISGLFEQQYLSEPRRRAVRSE